MLKLFYTIPVGLKQFYRAFRINDYVRAQYHIDYLCEQQPLEPEYLALRGVVSLRMGSYRDAVCYFKRSLTEDRSNLTALSSLSLIESACSDPEFRNIRLGMKHARSALRYSLETPVECADLECLPYYRISHSIVLISISLLNHGNSRMAYRYSRYALSLCKDKSIRNACKIIKKKSKNQGHILLEELENCAGRGGLKAD